MRQIKILIIILFLPVLLYGYTIEYQCNYLWCVKQFDFPNKDLRFVLLDTRQGIIKIFGDYAAANNLIIKPYGLAVVKISTEQVLKMFFFDSLTQLKQKVADYCQTNNITFAWKPYSAGSIKDWWLQKQ